MKPRRSWLIVPAHDAQAAANCVQHAPDVVVLDLEYTVPPRHKETARTSLATLAPKIADTQATVFVRIARKTRWTDVRAAVHRGIKGIIFPGADSAEEVAEVGDLIDTLEKERGVEPGATEIAMMLESARGFWDAADIASASPRVTALGVGRVDLTMRLGPVPQHEFRLHRFLMTRAQAAAVMLGKQPLGAMWRPDSRGGVATAAVTEKAAREARWMGFTGCICATAEQVAAVNNGFAGA
jgi:citrate lyase subunit beta/citryl-CoA lyase